MEGQEFKNEINIDEGLLPENKWPKKMKLFLILLIIFFIIILVLIIAIIYLTFIKKENSTNKKEEEEQKQDNPQPNPFLIDSFYSFFGTKYPNLSYAENGKIKNTFKSGGENHIDEIGDINNNEDYDSNELNTYDLYIPRYAEKRKNEINGIMLWIHGGWWIGGDMSMTSPMCELYSQLGYISANVNYTILVDEYKVFNIFRILDEITASIKAIKNELIHRGFDEDKLVLGIGGVSAGGHLALLYSYLIKNISIIPIKFVIDMVGPVGLREEYFYKLNSHDETLPNIEDISLLNQAKKEGKIIKVFPELMILKLMNAFIGNKYSKEEINDMLDEKGKIIYNDKKYNELYNVVKYGFITEVEDKHKLPTICVYGGSDDVIGVSSYAYLKEKAEKDNRHIDYIYSRYEGHILALPSTEDGKQAVFNLSALITQYFNNYFSEN